MIFWEMMRAWIIVKLIWNSLCSPVWLSISVCVCLSACVWVCISCVLFCSLCGSHFLILSDTSESRLWYTICTRHQSSFVDFLAGFIINTFSGTVQLQSLLASFIKFPLVFSKSKSAHHIKPVFYATHTHTGRNNSHALIVVVLEIYFHFPQTFCDVCLLRCAVCTSFCCRGGLHKIWLFLIKYACKRYKKLFVCFLSREREAQQSRGNKFQFNFSSLASSYFAFCTQDESESELQPNRARDSRRPAPTPTPPAPPTPAPTPPPPPAM